MSSEEQVCVIYAGVNGYLDKMDTSEIHNFEVQFLEYMRNTHKAILDDISKTGVLSAENDKKIGEISSNVILVVAELNLAECFNSVPVKFYYHY